MKTILLSITSLTLLIMLGILLYIFTPPRTGQGARFSTPQAALQDALGSQGWLGSFEQLTLLTQSNTPQGFVALYAGQNAGKIELGVADAKQSWLGWYAHGRFSPLPLPNIQDGATASCVMTEIPLSGKRFLVVTGRIRIDGANVDMITETQHKIRSITFDKTFASLMEDAVSIQSITIYNQSGQIIEHIPRSSCK